jgi:FAD/FMN-containing dehydrogenase
MLQEQLPSVVHLPGSLEYNELHSRYYSLQQQELSPACTVEPTTVQDVSRALRIAEAGRCQFAVASGGHMAWKGSSNIDDGFVFDLSVMNGIDISPKGDVVKLGPGSRWTDVYAQLAPHNISVPGARINNVGVAGFLAMGKSSTLHTNSQKPTTQSNEMSNIDIQRRVCLQVPNSRIRL